MCCEALALENLVDGPAIKYQLWCDVSHIDVL